MCTARVTVDLAAVGMALLRLDITAAVNPSLGLLLVAMVLGVAMINQLDDLAFALTVLLWLVGLIAATHTLLVVKGFCIALAVALAMRAAYKYVPDDEETAAAEDIIRRTKRA